MKRILVIIITLLLAVSLAGCSTDSLGDYKKAAAKTEQIKKGRTSGEFSLGMAFNTEGMTAEQIRELNYFQDMKGSFDAAYDAAARKGIFRNYLNFGGLGFDFDLFFNGDEVSMKLPMIGKYMRIDLMQASAERGQTAEGEAAFISADTQAELNAMWLGLVNREDVFKGKDIVLTTPDGEVKTIEYTIKLSDGQVKSLMSEGMDILRKDAKLKESFAQYFKKNIKPLKDKSLEELFSDMKESMKYYSVESFSYTAHVDVDGYIVNETVACVLQVENAKEAGLTGISYKLDIKNWDINKEQKFDFPVLTEGNTVDMDDMDKSMPFKMEDLFNKRL